MTYFYKRWVDLRIMIELTFTKKNEICARFPSWNNEKYLRFTSHGEHRHSATHIPLELGWKMTFKTWEKLSKERQMGNFLSHCMVFGKNTTICLCFSLRSHVMLMYIKFKCQRCLWKQRQYSNSLNWLCYHRFPC